MAIGTYHGVLAVVLDVAEDRRAKERKAEDADQAKERTKERKEQKEKTIRRARLVQTSASYVMAMVIGVMSARTRWM